MNPYNDKNTPDRLLVDRKVAGILMVFSVLGLCLVIMIIVSVNTFSGIRGFSTLQAYKFPNYQEVSYNLSQYVITADPQNLVLFDQAMGLIQTDRELRSELQRDEPDYEKIQGLLTDLNSHPRDISHMITTFMRFQHLSHFAQAITVWEEINREAQALENLASRIQEQLESRALSEAEITEYLSQISRYEARQNAYRDQISYSLSSGSRLINQIAIGSSVVLGLILLVTGSWLAFRLSNSIKAWQALVTESEQRYKSLFDHNPNAVFSFDLQANFLSANNSLALMLDTTVEDLLRTTFLPYVAPEDTDMVVAQYEKAKQGARPTYCCGAVTAKGKSLNLTITNMPIVVDGKIKGIYGIAKDITAKVQTEEALEKQRTRYTGLFAEAPVAIALLKGEAHVFENANRKYLALIGKQDIIGKSVLQVLPEVQKQGFIDLFDRVYTTGEPYIADEVFVTLQNNGRFPNGVYLNLVFQAYRNNSGEIEGVLVFAVNVTKQVEDRKRLEQSELEMRTLSETLPQLVWVTRPDGWHIYYNKRWMEYTGLTLEESLGHGWNQAFHPDDRERAWRRWKHSTQTGEVYEIEYRLKHADGTYRWVLGRALPMRDSNGVIIKWFGTCTDIDGQKRNEQQMRKMVDRYDLISKATGDRIYDWDLETGTLHWSDDEKAIGPLGYKDPGNTIDGWLSTVHPDDAQYTHDSLQHALNTAETFEWIIEYRIQKKDGTYGNILERGNILRDKKGKAVRMLGALQDITGRKIQESEREQLISALTRKNKDLEQFTYITSHNLKSPLSNLKGLLTLLEHITIEDEEVQTILNGFRTSTLMLHTTIEDLTKILLIKGNTPIEQQVISLGDTFDDVMQQTQNLINRHKPDMDIDFSEVPGVYFNKPYMESILLNLFTNAMKYRSPSRPLQIKVWSESRGNHVALHFKDNGLGINLDRHKGKIFGLYQRFHSGTNGKGMGLYLIKSQIEALGGSIELSSTVEEGTEFVLRFKK
ncbi:MAG: PAS domain S-box protein [Balneolales bacterium]